jgi:hypothetical protein
LIPTTWVGISRSSRREEGKRRDRGKEGRRRERYNGG